MLDESLGFDERVAAPGVRLAAIGNEDLSARFADVSRCRWKSLTVHHTSMSDTSDVAAVLERLASLLADGGIDPVVPRRYDLADVGEARRAVVEDSFLGKPVVTP